MNDWNKFNTVISYKACLFLVWSSAIAKIIFICDVGQNVLFCKKNKYKKKDYMYIQHNTCNESWGLTVTIVIITLTQEVELSN